MSPKAPIIEIESIWKKYSKSRIFHRSLREDIVNIFSANAQPRELATNEFWALQDISLSISPGEVVCFWGPNGAGKSTVLKLMANITYPNQGSITVRGRVAPIIDIGAGFHPDLTGYENIFVNGGILGMKIKEIKQKMQSIIEFSEIGEFINMPVKNYSSGMYLRLAFSIAIHSAADIYLFDEVLVVGDVNFQQKCMERIAGLKNQQKTIIFVSHHQPLVEKLSPRIINIEKGRLISS